MAPSALFFGSTSGNFRLGRLPFWSMRRNSPHQLIDRINVAQDQRIAARLRRDHASPTVARRSLRRWIARDGRTIRPVFQEWLRILTQLSRSEIADFLESETPMARRLRQSSPFAGVLSEAEREAIRQRHAKARD